MIRRENDLPWKCENDIKFLCPIFLMKLGMKLQKDVFIVDLNNDRKYTFRQTYISVGINSRFDDSLHT